ncbi:MAG: LysR substrate-binding domain-containing protein [Mesorhizobium sp.]
MNAPLDLDQLQTFIAISDTGSFTKAADEVFRTQSAVSMQMRRLEERIGKPLFEKDGRTNRLTAEGERLLAYARRMIRLNRETLAAFDDSSLEGQVRIGLPDDYADRFLPEIMGRFARSNPRIEMSVICEPTINLAELVRRGQLDIALVTHCEDVKATEIVRREPLLWVTSASHAVHEEPILPLALGRPTCAWRRAATEGLTRIGRPHRVLFTSWSAQVVIAAVMSGLAVSVLAECALRPGMRVLGEADGLPGLPDCEIGILRGHGGQHDIVDAVARHISDSLDNISTPQGEGGALDLAALAARASRQRASPVLPGW